MDCKMPLLKGFALPLLIGGVLFAIINGVGFLKTKPAVEGMVIVDTSTLIRGASENFARMGGDDSLSLTKKLEAYKTSLVQSLNQFAKQNNCLVFTANQVFGNLPNKTEDFMAFLEEEKH